MFFMLRVRSKSFYLGFISLYEKFESLAVRTTILDARAVFSSMSVLYCKAIILRFYPGAILSGILISKDSEYEDLIS